MKEHKKKRRRKKSLFRRFLTIVLSIVFSFVVIAGTSTFLYLRHELKKAKANNDAAAVSRVENAIDTLMGKKGLKLNVAVMGVDVDGFRSDVMFVVHFDSKTKTTNLLSLPRDTRVNQTEEIVKGLKERNRAYERTCKLNEVHSYAGDGYRSQYTVLQIEDLLGIKIDHYVKIDLDGFKNLVDAIGGVDLDVPTDMDYVDPTPNKGLSIHLKAGPQHLDGDKAEQLIRFRSYKTGDVQRVQVQQLFLREMAKKILSTSTIKNNLPSLIETWYNYVETDISITDALNYVRYIDDVDMNNLTMETLPGEGQYVNKVSYYLHDAVETQQVVDRLFYSDNPVEPYKGTDSKELSIEVSNGGTISGLAGKVQDMLVEQGYNVTQISTYDGKRQENTRIIVRQQGMGEDLKQYFDGSTIEEGKSVLSKDIDIKIILGTKEE